MKNTKSVTLYTPKTIFRRLMIDILFEITKIRLRSPYCDLFSRVFDKVDLGFYRELGHSKSHLLHARNECNGKQ